MIRIISSRSNTGPPCAITYGQSPFFIPRAKPEPEIPSASEMMKRTGILKERRWRYGIGVAAVVRGEDLETIEAISDWADLEEPQATAAGADK